AGPAVGDGRLEVLAHALPSRVHGSALFLLEAGPEPIERAGEPRLDRAPLLAGLLREIGVALVLEAVADRRLLLGAEPLERLHGALAQVLLGDDVRRTLVTSIGDALGGLVHAGLADATLLAAQLVHA